MAPKTPSRSHQPSLEKEEKHDEPSSEEEEEEEEEGSESQSSEEEEEKEDFSGETGVGSSEDEDQDPQKVKDSNPRKSVNQQNGSDSDDSDPGPPSNYKLQPISKTLKPPSKRGNENQNSLRISKKSKIDEQKLSSPSSTPGRGINRLWSDEDEVTVLNGMIEFKDVKGQDPNADMGAFYSFVKGKLLVDFSRDQLRTKIRRMKERFLNALGRGGDGEDPVFSKPHEDKAFELSKKIWGGVVGKSEGKKIVKKGVVKVVEKDEFVEVSKDVKREGEEGDFWSKYPFLSASFFNVGLNYPSLGMSESMMSFVKENLSVIGSDKAKELDEKWKQLTMEEVEVNNKMLNLMREQMKLAFNK